MSAQKSNEHTGDPNVATFLTWFLPGAGHLYLGRPQAAALAFVVVQGLFAAGIYLSGGMTFEFLDPELRGPFATVLTPEAANLGGLLYQMKVYGFGPGTPRPWPDTVLLGAWLTALSGLANVLVMVSANVSARRARGESGRGPSPALHVGLAWAVPGLGHLAQGRHLRGLIVFVLLVGLLVWGTWLSDGANLSRERHFYYWSGQFLAGLPALALELGTGRPPVTSDIELGDVGLLFGCLAGLLNVLALLDVHGWSEAAHLGQPLPGSEPATGEEEESVEGATG